MTATNSTPEQATPHEALVAANVRRFREAAGWSQAEVSDRAGQAGYDLGEMAIWSIEKGRRRIRVEDLFALAEVFGTTTQHLLSPEADPDLPSVQHEIRFEGGVTEQITADSVDWGKEWIRFLLRGELVYAAAASRVLGVRTTRHAGGES